MNKIGSRIARRVVLATCAGFLAGGIGAVQAATLSLTDNVWQGFDVDPVSALGNSTSWINIDDGTTLSFTLTTTLGGTLKVIDLGNAGDTFNVNIMGTGGQQNLATSTVPATSTSFAPLNGFDAALANPDFSRGLFNLAPGTYTISGSLLQSAIVDGAALDATSGALEFSPVPLPAALPLFLSALAGFGVAARRRTARVASQGVN